MTLNPRAEIEPLSRELAALVSEKDAVTAVAHFGRLVAAHRRAKMDWSHTLERTTALLAPLGLSVVEPLVSHIDAAERVVRDASGPRYETSPKLAASPWENARYEAAALRIALVRALATAAGGAPTDERFDVLFGPTPERLFEVPSKEGGKQHDFIARYLGALKLGGAVFQAMPEPRALTFIAAWRGFAPGKNLELSLKGLFVGRPRLLRVAPAPSMVDRARALAAQTGLHCTACVYLLEQGKSESFNRLGGRPKGLASNRAPRDLTPVLTVDLAALPELAARLPGTRALCLFVDAPRDGFDSAAVVRLTSEECEVGFSGGKPFSATRLEVPPEVFAAAGASGPLGSLYTLLRQAPGRALGVPFYLQRSDAHPGDATDFVLEAKADFTSLNLGDAGKLFLFLDDAFWESA